REPSTTADFGCGPLRSRSPLKKGGFGGCLPVLNFTVRRRERLRHRFERRPLRLDPEKENHDDRTTQDRGRREIAIKNIDPRALVDQPPEQPRCQRTAKRSAGGVK